MRSRRRFASSARKVLARSARACSCRRRATTTDATAIINGRNVNNISFSPQSPIELWRYASIQVVAAGDYSSVLSHQESLTGQYLSGRRRIAIPEHRRPGNGTALVVHGARQNNLKNVTVEFPLGRLICITGVGAGET